jgi:hypothetical protein
MEEEKMESTRGRPKGSEKYDWDKWLDGEPHTMEYGKDFFIPVANFRTVIWNAAKRRGLKVRTLLVDLQGTEQKQDIQFWAFKEES